MQMTGTMILEALKTGRMRKEDLSPHQRVLCVEVLMSDTKATNEQIAVEIGTDQSTVWRIKKKIQANYWRLVYPDGFFAFVSRFTWTMDMLFAKAQKKEDFDLACKIEIQKNSQLMDMGVLPSKGRKPDLSIFFGNGEKEQDSIGDKTLDQQIIDNMTPEEKKNVTRIYIGSLGRLRKGKPVGVDNDIPKIEGGVVRPNGTHLPNGHL